MRVLKPTQYHQFDMVKIGDICYKCGLPFKEFDQVAWFLTKDMRYFARHMASGCDKTKYDFGGLSLV